MKKLLFILAIGAFAACNDSAETSTEGTDTSATSTQAAPDTTVLKVDTGATVTADTTTKATDTLKK